LIPILDIFKARYAGLFCLVSSKKDTAMINHLKHITCLFLLLLFATQSFAQVYQQSGTGLVGVGPSTSPRGRFDVNGSGDIYLNQDPVNGAGQAIYLPGNIYLAPHFSGDQVAYLQARRSDNSGSTSLRIRTYNTGTLVEAMHIGPDGNVGIGTIYPRVKLELTGDIAIQDNSQFKLRGGNVIETGLAFVASQEEVRLTHTSDGFDRFITLGGYTYGAAIWRPQFKLNTKNGNVGIGTTPATDYKLAVNGKTWTTEVNVSLTVPGPDYVFEKGYVLPSLEWVKSYVNANKHLPEVPSAREMETDGINVSELNMTMLKKIEELTLYTIQLKEELDALKAEMKKAR
jgi:hypothetical protein